MLSAVPLVGCQKTRSGSEEAAAILNSDSIPSDVKSVVRAIAENDSDSFAKLVNYPLERPYPLHDITDSEEMKAYYSTLVDDSMRNAVTRSHVSDWESDGWRGWTVSDGNYIWIDSLVYDVNYVSKKEKREQKRLIDAEIASLPPELRKGGWKPERCIKGVNHRRVARIDSKTVQKADTNIYRIAVFDSITPASIHPSIVMQGYRAVEGTSETEYYIFSDGKGTRAIFETNIADSPNSYLIITKPNAPAEELEMEKAYWQDLLNPPATVHEAPHKAIPGLAPARQPARPQESGVGEFNSDESDASVSSPDSVAH